ncbi:hypothetical protein HUW46_05072 [Amycolatopsis sp. CA-230715]|nr:hypothetical protein HUW46_05072 [Amycolatopsis sp. CA-230715]
MSDDDRREESLQKTQCACASQVFSRTEERGAGEHL